MSNQQYRELRNHLQTLIVFIPKHDDIYKILLKRIKYIWTKL